MYLTKKIIPLGLILSLSILFAEEDEFFKPKASFGAYGELHVNYDSRSKKTISDFHRFVLFMGYAWTPEWSFKAEVELEHNFVKDGDGELELEQAYVLYQPTEAFGFNIGVILASVGLLNEHHEPPLFPSVERPIYSKVIIPTTWFGNGLGVGGTIAQSFEYRFNVMEGLLFSGIQDGKYSDGVRSGRQKGYKSDLRNLLFNLRFDYIGIEGLRTGLSISRNQGFQRGHTDESLTIYEAHIKYEGENGIYASGEVGYNGIDSGELRGSFGYYVDFGYNFGRFLNNDSIVIMPWLRWSDVSPDFKMDTEKEKANRIRMIEAGLAIKPIPFISFKIDYGYEMVGDSSTKDSHLFNAGMGFYF